MNGAFKVEGLKGLDKALSELKTATAKRLTTKVLKDAASPIAEDAAGRVHVDQGDLRDSAGVGTKLTRRQRTLHRKESDVEVFAGFGGLVQAITEEFGTKDVRANPALRFAWDAGKRPALDDVAKGLAENIEKAAKRARRAAGR